LPEAQLDRFLMHVKIDYPDTDEEAAILRLTRDEARTGVPGNQPASNPVSQVSLLQARQSVLTTYLAENLEAYLIEIVLATRDAGRYGDDLAGWIEYGGSPRATMAIDRCARAYAWLNDRDFVTPEDIQLIAPDVLRHRIILSFEAEAEGVTPDHCIDELIARIAVP
jgi:MoxR-like ATPase